ncbi:type II toxin-antitoxin system RelB/DinJ family antitoxin [Desulfolutivibrio sulfoxidireducens]|uniref:type II toxin-antitoxin system RelB/DinJ family antitoxin n=1 Tax=Desulfolutivibrio sulfoxidireducens TaxID=2773299 RepID=UPI00159D6E0C|nr:type II toxin-antitoxin system RelB/DinJ family antitoxin [Desulfolutivibrio sulfoxidireducens]QLA17631.1 type II toxin-antitoxin system RelB/DinJ family antitoxin [Desulfolutivibrio sulfoxidireducens]
MKNDMIRVRMDAELKQGVESILADLGLSPSAAINLFYRQVVLHNGLPFPVKIPRPDTGQAIKDALSGENLVSFASSEELFKSLKGKECAFVTRKNSAGTTHEREEEGKTPASWTK